MCPKLRGNSCGRASVSFRQGKLFSEFLPTLLILGIAGQVAFGARAPRPDSYGYIAQPAQQFSFLQITTVGSTRVPYLNDDASVRRERYGQRTMEIQNIC